MKNVRDFLYTITKLLLIVTASLSLFSCGEGCSILNGCVETDDDSITIAPSCDSNDVGLVDGCGEAITAIDIHDPVIINLQGLSVNTEHDISITDVTPTDISTLSGHAAGSSAVTSDKDGNIYMATVVQNMTDAAILGDYTVTVDDGVSTPQTWTYTVEDLNRVQCSDTLAVAKASFTSSENVFASVNSSLADGDYNIFVISDSQTAIPDGGLIPGSAAASITLSDGLGTADLGIYSSGAYDVLVDVNGNGAFNRDTDLISRHARLHPCFAIQSANAGAIDQIAADQKGNRREIFDPDADKSAIRDVFASVTPSNIATTPTSGTADIYVVNHQDVWTNGDALTDLSGSTPPAANNAPRQNDTNSQGNMLQWSFSNFAGGCYDIVIDTNGNGSYDSAEDNVDNMNHLGDSTDCGLRISTPDSTYVTITSHDDDEVTLSTAIELSGTVNIPTGLSLAAAYIRITSGTQTNIISMDSLVSDGGGSYSGVQLPLFSGDNYITVSGVYDDNMSRSETITIRSVTDLALFRAQLTWDGSTDMDLHLVRPGGSYSNGGGGEDDCNWGNCKVGLDGTGTNTIDWGILNDEADDPKLDVDCISCGNGIENIWMTETNENGAYEVYVDAYSGSETNVTVTISILGSTVSQINCGSMEAGSSTDTCYVGDINWSGGTSGAGSFTPVGTKAADY